MNKKSNTKKGNNVTNKIDVISNNWQNAECVISKMQKDNSEFYKNKKSYANKVLNQYEIRKVLELSILRVKLRNNLSLGMIC